ncbi:MAG: GntR family transcriptional regulator [Spirochaetales bacterium]|nr:GntR family transcriptional regulator [Spirochaetales bacterium]
MNGINIINQSEKPIYKQLYEQISSQIINGELCPGYNLPPIRVAAKEMGVSVITVKKAWEELEREGLIYTTPGKGCFVADFNREGFENKKMNIAEKQLKEDLKFYKTLGISKKEFLILSNELFDK